MDTPELEAWLRLSLSPGIGNEAARRLLAAFGSAPAIFRQDRETLVAVGNDKLAHAILARPPALPVLLQTTIDWLAGGDDRCIATLGDSAYPPELINIEDPPLLLYMQGSLATAARAGVAAAPRLAIVGSRNPTPQGEANARDFARFFGEAGLCIVSGLALGVDGAAHDGALLAGSETIAVVGTGLDRVYPKKHLALAHRIAARGMLISEYPLGTPPLPANFPRRNRIISGLSLGTLVVEATLKSGSLITARMAAEQGKDVFAIPGSIHSPQSRGCHALIKQGAKLVELAQDVMEELRLPLAGAATHAVADSDDSEPDDSQSESALLQALGFDPVSLDALQARTGMDTPHLQADLLGLELAGHLARLPGGLFQRLASG